MGGPEKKMKMEAQEDRISQLPAEILVSILSLLPSKQSVRTSVLAKSWRNLWKHLAKQVLVVFPSFHFDFLKNMSIGFKKAQGFNIQDILTNCPLLEHLRLVRSNSVTSLNVSSELLKKLEIIGCCNLQKIEFHAPELVSFKYNGPDTVFDFVKVPSLVELSLVESYSEIVIQRKFEQFEPIVDQIERINLIQDLTWINEFPKIDGLRNIKKVRLDIRVWDHQRPLRLFNSIRQAMPSLKVLLLGLYWHPDRIESMEASKVEFENHHEHGLIKVFNMKRFKLAGFELKIIEDVVKRAVSRENVVLRACMIGSVESDEDIMDVEMTETIMYEAEM